MMSQFIMLANTLKDSYQLDKSSKVSVFTPVVY